MNSELGSTMDDNTKFMLLSVYYQLAYAELVKNSQEGSHSFPDEAQELDNQTECNVVQENEPSQNYDAIATPNSNHSTHQHYHDICQQQQQDVHSFTSFNATNVNTRQPRQPYVKKPRTVFTRTQTSILEGEFARSCYASPETLNQLSDVTGLSWRIIKVHLNEPK